MSNEEIRDVFNILHIQIQTGERYDPYEFGKKLMQNGEPPKNIRYSDRTENDSENKHLKAVYG